MDNYIGQQDFIIGSTNAGGTYLILDGDSNGDAIGSDYAYIAHDTGGDVIIGGDNPSGNADIIFKAQASTSSPAERMRINSNGLIPGTTNAYDLGTSTVRWRNIFSQDLHLSNEDTGGNDVDGTEDTYRSRIAFGCANTELTSALSISSPKSGLSG